MYIRIFRILEMGPPVQMPLVIFFKNYLKNWIFSFEHVFTQILSHKAISLRVSLSFDFHWLHLKLKPRNIRVLKPNLNFLSGTNIKRHIIELSIYKSCVLKNKNCNSCEAIVMAATYLLLIVVFGIFKRKQLFIVSTSTVWKDVTLNFMM